MNIKYKVSYLSNGTKVKITNELFEQLKKWEIDKVNINDYFRDELKKQDNVWINKNRQYHRNTISMESLLSEGKDYFLIDNSDLIEEFIFKKELFESINSVLISCTQNQRRRFKMHFVYGMSYREIARVEHRNKETIKISIEKTLKMLKNYEQL